MGFMGKIRGTTNAEAILAAMNRSLAVIEFGLSGKVIHANENFLRHPLPSRMFKPS